jgi:hypothetical protein
MSSPFAPIHFVSSIHTSKIIVKFIMPVPLLVLAGKATVFGLHEKLGCHGSKVRVGASTFIKTLKVSIQLFKTTSLRLLLLWLAGRRFL